MDPHEILNTPGYSTKCIRCSTKDAPSYMSEEEAQIWSKGAVYGAMEMLAAILITLRGKNAHQLAAELEMKVRVVQENVDSLKQLNLSDKEFQLVTETGSVEFEVRREEVWPFRWQVFRPNDTRVLDTSLFSNELAERARRGCYR